MNEPIGKMRISIGEYYSAENKDGSMEWLFLIVAATKYRGHPYVLASKCLWRSRKQQWVKGDYSLAWWVSADSGRFPKSDIYPFVKLVEKVTFTKKQKLE